jgi:hypothetical protein
MKPKMFLAIIFMFSVLLRSGGSPAIGENIDPDNNDHQYAWGENIGWLNFEPSTGPGVTVTDTDVTGVAWGENIGWIVFNPSEGGVFNDGYGNLSGCAWGENVGWISFSCETIDCNSVDYGVSIDPATGMFSGMAWGENIGWISFDYESLVTHGVQTSWGSSETCYGDFDPDGDVDGSDLAELADDPDQFDLVALAVNFGRTDCD